jgi:DNA-binding FrmR family transcriptional regulator
VPAKVAVKEVGVACGCEVNSHERKAVAVDPQIKASNLKRLRRIEGQVRGLQKMVETDRYCSDILVQVSSVQEALRGVSQALLRNHLRHCATAALTSANTAEGDAICDELVELFAKFSR